MVNVGRSSDAPPFKTALKRADEVPEGLAKGAAADSTSVTLLVKALIAFLDRDFVAISTCLDA
jgi:hypothetical protein